MRGVFLYGKLLTGEIVSSIANTNVGGWLIKLALFVWALFSQDTKHLAIIVFCLTIIDTITGLMAAKKQGIKFKLSRLFRKGLLEKFLIYNSLILSFWLLAKVLNIAFSLNEVYIVGIVVILIGCYEVSSIVEKLQILAPNIPFLETIKGIVGRIQKKAENRALNAIDETPLNIPDDAADKS